MCTHPKMQAGLRALGAIQGAVLLLASTAKTYELATVPIHRYLLPLACVLIAYEASLGSWLLFGIYSRTTWRVAVCTFAMFGVTSATKVATGEVSCGCFGTITVNPLITAGMNLVSVIALVFFRHGVVLEKKHRRTRILAAPVAVAVLCAWGIAIGTQMRVTSVQDMRAGAMVVLEPESWIGKRFELLEHLDTQHDLTRGDSSLLFFREECHVCHDVMVELADQIESGQVSSVVLVGLGHPSPNDVVTRLKGLGCDVGSLPADTEWFVTTPLRVVLHDGVCVAAENIIKWDVRAQ